MGLTAIERPTPPLKGSLKKTTTVMKEANQPRITTAASRKVSWSDAHGKDIAHVQEFETISASQDGKLKGVHNSCISCAIQ